MAAVADYPFSNWEDYYAALGCSLTSCDYNFKYPEYARMCDNGYRADADIILELLENGCNPQEGFDNLLKTLIVDHRYSCDFMRFGSFDRSLDLFFGRGAKFNLEVVLMPYISTEARYFEDEACTATARARILHILTNYVPDLLSQLETSIQWSTIEPVHWEDNFPLEGEFLPAYYAAIKYEFNDIDL